MELEATLRNITISLSGKCIALLACFVCFWLYGKKGIIPNGKEFRDEEPKPSPPGTPEKRVLASRPTEQPPRTEVYHLDRRIWLLGGPEKLPFTWTCPTLDDVLKVPHSLRWKAWDAGAEAARSCACPLVGEDGRCAGALFPCCTIRKSSACLNASQHCSSRSPAVAPKSAVLFFLHIPKCGGSEIKWMIRGWAISQHGAHVFQGLEDFAFEDVPYGARVASIGGHFGFGLHLRPEIHDIMQGRRAQYVTVLRRPRKRLFSLHAYELREPGSGKTYTQDPANPDFSKWLIARYQGEARLASGAAAGFWNPWFIDNPMARQLCCFCMWPSSVFHAPVFGQSFVPCVPSANTSACAKRHLNTFIVVGLTEDMDKTIALLARRVGVLDTRVAGHVVNSRPQKEWSRSSPHVTREAEDVLTNVTHWDEHVYGHASDLFKRMLKSEGLANYR